MQQHTNKRKHQEESLTMADLARAIERRRVPFSRKGDEYVVRQADVRKLQPHYENLSGIPRRREMLDMGCSA